jgi:hypothetical protein
MMHASPAITAWTMRWTPDPAWTRGLSPAAEREWASATFAQLFCYSVLFYLAWAAAYSAVTFVVLRARLERKGYKSMFTLMVLEPKARKSALARLVLRAPARLQPVAYMGLHATAAIVATLPVGVFWHYKAVHTAALLACLGMGVWNGGGYYFKVFAKRYEQERAEKEALRTARGGNGNGATKTD